MKYLKIKVEVDVPKEGCFGCQYVRHVFNAYCLLFRTVKERQGRTIYNNRPCKQCMEARGEK